MKKSLVFFAVLFSCFISHSARAQTNSGEETFSKHANDCLIIMEQAALKMKVKGVAVLAFIPDNKSITWISKMRVVGTMSNESSNYLAVAYSKMGEMAETFKDSGSGVREPKTGEFGWQGGTIKKVKAGYILAAFSGASGQQDFDIASEGLDQLKSFF
jgi:hypothetical protein